MKQSGEIIIYQAGQDAPSIQVLLVDDTLWLDQYQISELFETEWYRYKDLKTICSLIFG